MKKNKIYDNSFQSKKSLKVATLALEKVFNKYSKGKDISTKDIHVIKNLCSDCFFNKDGTEEYIFQRGITIKLKGDKIVGSVGLINSVSHTSVKNNDLFKEL